MFVEQTAEKHFTSEMNPNVSASTLALGFSCAIRSECVRLLSRHGHGRGQSESGQAGRRWPRRQATPAGPARTGDQGGQGGRGELTPALPTRSCNQTHAQTAALACGGHDWLNRSTWDACWLRLITAETEGPKRCERMTRRAEETRMDPRDLRQVRQG